MNKLIAVTVCAITSFALFSLPAPVAAQGGNIFSIVINPLYPTPFSTFKLSLRSYSFDVSNAVFTVAVNGTRVAKGTGAIPVELKTSGPGTTMNIVVSVAVNGKNYEDTLAIHPAGVAVVVEPLSTVPARYPGMPTIPTSGKIRVVAIPEFHSSNGKQISPQKLSYTWHIGNQTLSTSSGVGRSAVVVSAPLPYRETKLSVTVQAQGYLETAAGSVTLVSGVPTVRIYKNDPLMGVLYDHALFGNQTVNSAEASFVAVPYGFSLSSGPPTLVWYLNGTQAQKGSMVTLRPRGVGKGVASLSINVAKKSTYESASDAITLKFGKAARNSLGIFGL